MLGEISEAKILARLLEMGKEVAIPFGDSSRYDLVIIESEKAIRVQCKTGFKRKATGDNVLHFATCSCNPFTNKTRGYNNDVDLFAVYYPANGKVYLVPIEEVKQKREFTLRLEPPLNRQIKGIRMASSYEF